MIVTFLFRWIFIYLHNIIIIKIKLSLFQIISHQDKHILDIEIWQVNIYNNFQSQIIFEKFFMILQEKFWGFNQRISLISLKNILNGNPKIRMLMNKIGILNTTSNVLPLIKDKSINKPLTIKFQIKLKGL